MRIVTFVNKKLAVSNITVLARILEHVSQLREELVPPVLRLVLLATIPAVLVTNNIAIGPPLSHIWDNVFASVVTLLLSIVGKHAAVLAVKGHIISPIVRIIFVSERSKNHDTTAADHHKDTAPHVMEQIV